MKQLFIAIFSITIGGCAAVGLPEENSSEAQVFKQKCTQCHSWPHPHRHTAREWDHYVNLMETHMKNKNLPFSLEEKKTILNYLKRNAR